MECVPRFSSSLPPGDLPFWRLSAGAGLQPQPSSRRACAIWVAHSHIISVICGVVPTSPPLSHAVPCCRPLPVPLSVLASSPRVALL
eukprot:5846318-Pyramimonas_sp.AAC.1